MSAAWRGWARRALWPLSPPFAWLAAARVAAYRRGVLRRHRLPVPVVSVGNLAVGGTGKTPAVAWLVARAVAAGRRPGVLARGYGRAPGAALNDEGLLLAARFPGLPQRQDPDRAAAGRALVAEHDVDLVILDDGFQHVRLERDVDIVCLDARAPFPGGATLPAGDLRESPRALRRASVIVLTRADGVTTAELDERRYRLGRITGDRTPVFVARHAPAGLGVVGAAEVEPIGALRGRRVLLLSAIARPQSFELTAAAAGAVVVGHVAARDHHLWRRDEVERHLERARSAGAELLTTEKDAVKLASLGPVARVLRVDLEFVGDPPPADLLGLQ